MKKLLIIGGSGFVGTSITDYGANRNLIKHNISKVYVISRSKKLTKTNYPYFKVNYINMDIINVKKIPEVDFIIYCIKNKNIKTSNTYFNKFVKILKKLSNKPKILFISSGAVYGKNKFKRKNIENEKLNIKTINSLTGYKKEYAKEKIFIEEKIKQLGYQNYKVAIARCYTFIGKNILRYKYAASDLINDGFYKSKIKLNTKIDVYRSYMHSDDLVKWLIVILKNSSENCPIYNVGSDKVINLKNLTKKIGKLLKKEISIKKIKSNKFDYYVPSINKAKNKLNLKISINLNDALNSTIKSLND